ncbi:MAG: hypothetical protein IT585_09925 [candidate division Zixibacteria bacterium]|nr:hypothetical protein [candidate division Zixibacteria bacterium]
MSMIRLAAAARVVPVMRTQIFSEMLKVFVDLMLLQVESIPRNMRNEANREIEEAININASNIASTPAALFVVSVLRQQPLTSRRDL